MVPVSQHAISAPLQERIAGSIVCTSNSVLPAIDFDHQPAFNTGEICNVTADGVLAPEACSGYLAATEVMPEFFLGIGEMAAQAPCALCRP